MIKFNNVTYKVSGKIILSNITFNIKGNEKVLICGSSGSGKSTIFNLMVRHIRPTSGEIFYKNNNINKFTNKQLSNYRKNIVSLISQVDDLFIDKTVLENLLIFYEEKDIIDILNKTKLYHLKDKVIATLSGGERQRIAIIKEFLSDNPIMLCDEITSALDSKSANDLLSFILTNFNDKTIIFISHDLTLFKDKVDRIIQISNSKVIANTLYKSVKQPKTSKVIKKKKNEFIIVLKQCKRNFSISFLLVYLILIICFYVCINFTNICEYYAKQSYIQYFNYDVVHIYDNSSLKEDNINIYKDISKELLDAKITINGINITSKNILPFNNKNNYTPLVVNHLLLERLNISKISKIKILLNENIYQYDNIDVIYENNTFTVPTIYYDFKYFNEIISCDTTDLIMIIDNFILDDRFTNNPMFEDKKEDKPYIGSLAYQDYLTYHMIFDSIKSIVDYYVIIISVYCFVTSILMNFSIIKKDSKRIAIYLSKGFKDISILLNYLIPILVYSFFVFIISLFIKSFLIPLFISLLLQILAIIVSYYFIKNKLLYITLKEEYLV